MKCQEKVRERKEKRMRPEKRQWHELLHTEIVKSGTVRLTSGANDVVFVKISFWRHGGWCGCTLPEMDILRHDLWLK